MSCLVGGANNNLNAWLSVNVDATTDGAPLAQGFATWDDCSDVANYLPTHSRTVSNVFYVGPGPHAVYLLGRKDNDPIELTTGTVRYIGRTLTAQFIAANAQGQISLPETSAAPAVDLSAMRRSR